VNIFENHSSNTIAGSGNQSYFLSEKERIHTGRVFYKIACPGEYRYSLLFSNIIDSTYSTGEYSHMNLICDAWEIHEARAAVCGVLTGDLFNPKTASEINGKVGSFVPLTFGGSGRKTVAPGEFFSTDPVSLSFAEGEFLCLELTFSGEMVPYHEESILPVFRKTDSGWEYDKRMPLAGMVGCDRPVRNRVGFLGDSITQGIGVPVNSYLHWNAICAEALGSANAYWNLGLGFGRANDMASGGAWAFKAKQNDILTVCYGVNDIMRGLPQEQTEKDLAAIVAFLKKEGKKVILQTIPPFNYSGETLSKWNYLNSFIRETLSKEADLLFDVVPILGEPDAPYMAKYGGHPDEQGCKLWGEGLAKAIKEAGLL